MAAKNCGCGGGSGCGYYNTTGCATTVAAECVFYQGNKPLDKIGGTYGERLETLLVNINDLFNSVLEQIQDGFIGQNVGGGIEIYKGLNADDIGELRTLRSTESIVVTNDDDTIAFAVRQSWINGIVNPITGDLTEIKNSISDILSRLDTYDRLITEIQLKNSDQDASIADLQQKYLNLQQDVTNLHTEVNTIHQEILDMRSDITQIKADVTNLIDDVAEIKTQLGNLTKTYSEEFVGQNIVAVSRNIDSVVGVYFQGLKLSEENYVFQAPNQIALSLASAGLIVESTDVIQVVYNVQI